MNDHDSRSLGEMAERDRRLAAEAAHDAELERQEALAEQHARAAEDMEDSQRLLAENAQRLAEVRELGNE